MWSNPQFSAVLVTIIEEIFDGKLQFLCSPMPLHILNLRSAGRIRLK